MIVNESIRILNDPPASDGERVDNHTLFMTDCRRTQCFEPNPVRMYHLLKSLYRRCFLSTAGMYYVG